MKRRSLANSACDESKVFVNGKPVKPAYRLKIGDEVTIEFLSGELKFIVKSLNDKASKDEAPSLYEIVR